MGCIGIRHRNRNQLVRPSFPGCRELFHCGRRCILSGQPAHQNNRARAIPHNGRFNMRTFCRLTDDLLFC